MFIRMHSRGRRRRGGVLPWLVVTAPILLAVFALAVNVASLRHRQLELHNAADAAVLAAAHALADDRLLTDDPERFDIVSRSVRTETRLFAAHNRVDSKPLHLHENLTNDNGGEIVLGTLDSPISRAFDDLLHPNRHAHEPNLNAVRVAVRRTGAAASSTAYLDRDVIGFRIQGKQTLPGQTEVALPLMPLAIRTDPCPPGLDNPAGWVQRDPLAWEYQILGRQGSDNWSIDPIGGQPVGGGDRIPEMTLTITSKSETAKENCRGIGIGLGMTSGAEVIRQVGTGITETDLLGRSGQFLLDDGLGLHPPENRAVLPQVKLSAEELNGLAAALQGIIGQRRIWMLYDLQAGSNDATVTVRGFVAARVLGAQTQKVAAKDGSSYVQMTIVLQPCQLVTPTAVTDRGRRDLGPRTIFNPYIGRVRLVE